MSTVIRGARIVVGDGEPTPADLLLHEGRIRAVGVVEAPEDSEVIDAEGRIAIPGLVDTHSHADAAVFREDVQLALLRQGVTSIVAGQDGVSFAPGDGAWAGEYFGAINGRHPTYRGGGIAALLSTYDGTTPINVACLVPAGTVRHEVMGDDDRTPDAGELVRMVELVRTGMREGAVGLSSGLDYVPGIFASAEELAALCAPVADAGGVYVTHMRGGYEDNSRAGIEEAERICRASGVGLHVSHFHARADEVERLMGGLSDAGVTASFDMYPYTRGNSLLAMLLLPPWLNRLGGEQAATELADGHVRARLRQEWIPTVAAHPSLGAAWPEMITVSHIAADEFAWAHGRTLGHIARERGRMPHPPPSTCSRPPGSRSPS
ncbi:amidohydrolase family protein [Microbacterium sp. NIBRBAC000506063]|uniref:amidohydrolase family protein n=1 Tax=Microbacterium sp. NIBRBAC000506063 TaxID=2734618 RepID=UPI001CB70027|nr:amidohydrolase family protein [Microbacterium sp. NIBRBAC000506063]